MQTMEVMKETNETKAYRTHQIHIKNGHRLYGYLDELTKNANNLYNTTNFYIRQAYTALHQTKPLEELQKEVMNTIQKWLPFINEKQTLAFEKKLAKEMTKPKEEQKPVKKKLFETPSKERSFLGYSFLDALFKTTKQKDYYALPGQVNQQVMKNCEQNWRSFFASLKEYAVHPEKYKGKPRIPGYQPKGGRKEVTLSNQICPIKDGKYIRFPKTKHRINIGKLAGIEGRYQQVRVIPNAVGFIVELIFHTGNETTVEAAKKNCMGVDLGVDNLATVVTNTGNQPVLFKGTILKSINQWYNKQRAHYMAALRNGKTEKEGVFHSKRLGQLDNKRHLKMKDVFHKVSRLIVNQAKDKNIDTIIIGQNTGWKQEVNLGKKNNQTFSSIPHARLIQMIQYKAHAEGIAVIVNEESYTSKASFLDNDSIPTYEAGNQTKHVFSGKRIKRGLYKSKNGILLNADVNGAANILRKVVPNAFWRDGIAALCVTPLVVNAR